MNSTIVKSLFWVFENVRNPFSVLEINCLDGSIHDNVFHVPVNKRNDFVGFILIRVIKFIISFNNGVLVVIVKNEEMS